MANKRRPLSFPEFEPKGRGAILRSAAEVQAEAELLEDQETGMPESQHASMPDFPQAGIPDTQYAGTPESQPSGNRAHYPKATYRLSPETLEAIDDAKRLLRRRHKIRASLEEIAEEAILAVYQDLLDNQQTSILVNKLSGKPASQNARNVP